MSTATAKGDGYDKGDVVIQVPKTLGNDIHDFVDKSSQCANGQVDKTDLGCVDRVAENLMSQASQGGRFRDLVLVTATLPGLKGDLGTHLANLLKSATHDITGFALGDDGVRFLAEIAFWIVYEQLVKKSTVADQVVIPAASTTSAATAATSSSSCPPEDRKPNCSNCGSTQKNEGKSSGFCPGPKWKGCPCVDGPSYPFGPLDAAALAKAQAVLKDLLKPTCPAPGNNNLAQNRCDEKCMGKGWGKCDPDEPGSFNSYTCYCNDGPCGGQQCGDPVKIDKLTNKGTKCPVSFPYFYTNLMAPSPHLKGTN